MIYVNIAERHVFSHWTDEHNEFKEYRDWLELHAGPEDVGWKWRRGNMVAQGVYIQDEDVAIVFKLKFGL